MGSKIMNFDFWSQIWSEFFISDLSESFTRMNFEVEKSTGKVRFAWFCHVRVKNRVKGRNFRTNFDFKKSKFDIWSQFWPWKWQNRANLIWPVDFSTSKFILVKISDKSEMKNSDQVWLQKSKFMIFDPIFVPENGKIM